MVKGLTVGIGVLTLAILVPVAQTTLWMGEKVRKAKDAATRRELLTLKTSLAKFKSDCGRYPTTAEGLAPLTTKPKAMTKGWTGPYLSQLVITDPWDNRYRYVAKGKGFELTSFGSDGKKGSLGFAADLTEKG